MNRSASKTGCFTDDAGAFRRGIEQIGRAHGHAPGGRFAQAQHILADIADIMVMRRIAPGPAAAEIEHVETLAMEKFGNQFGIVARGLADRGDGEEAAARHGARIMRREQHSGERDIGDIAAHRMDSPIENDRAAGQAESVRRARAVALLRRFYR